MPPRRRPLAAAFSPLALPFALALGCGANHTPDAGAPAAPTNAAAHHEHAHGHEHGHGPLGHRFEHAEEWARTFDDPTRDAWQKPAAVTALLQLAPGATVADVGAGTGYFEPYLSKAVGPSGRVLALDIEPDMVRYLGERGARDGWKNVTAQVVGGDDPRLPAGAVDRILIVDTWHHIPDREAYATRLRDALAPGGFVLVVDFTKEASHGPPPAHRLPPEQVVRELEAGGLHASIVPEELPEQYAVAGRR